MTLALHAAALALYALAAVAFSLRLARVGVGAPGSPIAGAGPLARGSALALTGLALLVHATGLASFWVETGNPPLAGLGPCLSTLGWLVGAGSLGASLVAGAGPLGLVLVPAATLLTAIAVAVGVDPVLPTVALRGVGLVLHVLLAFLGYAGLVVAFAAGLMYLMQHRELKGKRFGAVYRFFPPLVTLERTGRAALMAGFVSLSAALALAWASTARASGAVPRAPEVVWGVLTWATLLLALGAQFGRGRRAHRGAVASVVGFAVVVVAYLVLRVGGDGGTFL